MDEWRRTVQEVRRRLKPGAPFVAAHFSFLQGEDQRELWLSRYAALLSPPASSVNRPTLPAPASAPNCRCFLRNRTKRSCAKPDSRERQPFLRRVHFSRLGCLRVIGHPDAAGYDEQTCQTPHRHRRPGDGIPWCPETQKWITSGSMTLLQQTHVAAEAVYAPDKILPIFAEMTELLCRWQTAFPTLMELESIGPSYEGRDIWGVTLTNQATGLAADKPGYHLDANIHAGEPTGSAVILYTIDWLLRNYGADPRATFVLDTLALYLVPRICVDGVELWMTTTGRPALLGAAVRRAGRASRAAPR